MRVYEVAYGGRYKRWVGHTYREAWTYIQKLGASKQVDLGVQAYIHPEPKQVLFRDGDPGPTIRADMPISGWVADGEEWELVSVTEEEGSVYARTGKFRRDDGEVHTQGVRVDGTWANSESLPF